MEGLMSEFDIAEADLAAVDKEIRKFWFLWAGCFGQFPALVTVILIMGGRLDGLMQGNEHLVNILMPVFLITSMVLIAVSVWLRKQLLSDRLRFLTDGAVKQAGGGQAEWIVRYRAGKMFCIVLPGVAGPMGFLLCLFSGNMLLFGLFMVVGCVATIYHRPRREELIECYHRFQGNCP